MLLVVDANIVVSALLKKGVTFDVFLLNHIFRKFEFVAPEFLMVEVENHMEELSRETKLSGDEFNEVIGFLMGEINLVPSSQFADFLPKGREVSPHFKDFEYLALALKLGCPIFSGDKALKRQSSVKVLSSRELLDLLLSSEKASWDDRAALGEAMREHERGETAPLGKALRKLK